MTRARTWIQRKSDRGVSTMLSLLVAGRGPTVEIIALDQELTTRAMLGAKMGDG